MSCSTTAAYDRSFALPAPAEKVWAALRDPQALRTWFAEHVEIEPRVGGAYRFWGRHTIFVPTRGEANQILTRWEPRKALAFTWTWSGIRSEVVLELAPHASETQLRVQHRFIDAQHGSPADFWKVAMANLKHYLAHGKALLLPDLSPSDDPSRAVVSIEIAAPPEDVFRALTEPELLDRWIASKARVDLDRGEYSYGWTYAHEGKQLEGGPRRIRAVTPNRLLETDWHFAMLGENSFARWELEPLGSGSRTRVTITHGTMARPQDYSDHVLGWAAYLGVLKEVSEGLLEASSTGRR